jgi:hypothetical protein
MSVYSYAEACQNFAKLLNEAKNSNDVIIKTNSGELFNLQLISKKNLLNNLTNANIGLSREEILSYIKEIRER